MKVRYTINERGELESRDGRVLGRLLSLTLEEKGGTTGGDEDHHQEPRLFSENGAERTEGGAGEGSILDGLIAEVYGYWRQQRPSAREPIPAGTYRQLKRAIKAGYSTEQLKAMIDALLASEWHRARNLQKLSTIFATKPGGATFEDQLDYWLERRHLPSPDAVKGSQAVERAKEELRFRDVHGSHERACQVLEENGWTVVWKPGRHGTSIPTFQRA